MENKGTKTTSKIIIIILLIAIIALSGVVMNLYKEINTNRSELIDNNTNSENLIEDEGEMKDAYSSEEENKKGTEDIPNEDSKIDNVENREEDRNKQVAKLHFDEKGYSYPKFYYGTEGDGKEEDSNRWEYSRFVFKENGEVEYVDYQAVFKGTYKILNDKIECDFKEYQSEAGGNNKGKFDKDITLKIVSENEIIGNTLEKRIKTNESSEEDVIEFYWGIQKVVYELK